MFAAPDHPCAASAQYRHFATPPHTYARITSFIG